VNEGTNNEKPLLATQVNYGAAQVEKKDKPAEDEEEEDCEEEEDEQFWELTESQLKLKAFGLLLLGTGAVTIFSDPMVDVISNLGSSLGISPFYISFVVTPVASNASEVMSGLIFAKKKTNEGISLTFASLHGAATMNHTLALCIFMALVYFRKLSWNYSAEVIAVCVVSLVVGINGLRQTVFMWQALLCACMYPFAILLVYALEQIPGFD